MACSLKDTVSLGRGKCGVGGGLRQLIPSAHRKQRADRKWCQGKRFKAHCWSPTFSRGLHFLKVPHPFKNCANSWGPRISIHELMRDISTPLYPTLLFLMKQLIRLIGLLHAVPGLANVSVLVFS